VVRMGNEVDLGAGARVLPPVLLGDDTRIGERATVGQGSVVGAKVSIGKDAMVSQSILLDGARVEAGARVTRMLVGMKASLSLAPAPAEPKA
ncbi:MAG TPA: hypothetical protein VFH51_16795, partial [Myxococcota bacterium]|nr:hypothetical protein [Myxococcota bacterium]